MPELLLELFSEEIPARMQQSAAKELEKMVNDRLLGSGYQPEAVKSFVTPRRLTLVVLGVDARQPDRREEKKGPRVGAPEKALEGFLKSAGKTSVDECEVRSDKKGEFYVAVVEEKGRDTADVIADYVPEIVRSFPWPKSMRWGGASADDGSLKWVRPLKSILCVFNDEIVPFDIEGIASGDVTYGHRFMASDEISVRNFEAYEAALSKAKVVLDSEARAEQIARDAKTLCEAQGLELIEDNALLKEVAGLAEWPVTMIGSFDEKFLSVPDEALIASMRGHQKYFSVRDPKTGKLANKFIYVANIEAPDGGAAMRQGYERVLTARLSDAWFLYQKDLEVPLADRAPNLDRITFFEGLGSVGDKVRRVTILASEIASIINADKTATARAAALAKTDLVTGMVAEFPELQGLMGRYYAIEQDEDAAVADAIRDHYKPLGQNDDAPTASVSVAVALAEKIDTLVSFWAIDKKPTGSKDPFALRRAALGVIETILTNNIRIRLGDGVFNGPVKAIGKTDTFSPEDLLSFFHDRLKVYLRDKGYRHDHIEAVLESGDGQKVDDFSLVVRRLEALSTFLKTDDGSNLITAYKRAANILKAEEKKGPIPDAALVEGAVLGSKEEKDLFDSQSIVGAKVRDLVAAENFEDAMNQLASLRAPIDAFFENVIVNADDESVRFNRLSLLQRFRDATKFAADLSKLEG